MTDVVSFGVDFDGNRAFKGMDTLRSLLERTKNSAKTNTADISNSFRRLNNTPVHIKGLDQIARDMERTRAQTQAALRQMRASIESLPKPVSRAQSAFAGFAGGLAAIGFTYVINGLRETGRAFVDFTDKASNITAKLTLATNRFGDFAQANKDVLSIANKTRADIGAVTDLYATMARNAERLKLSQEQVATATRTVGMALKISGADTAASAGAIRQLSQAMASGVLRGDEFNSVNEAAPRLMELIADAAGKPVGALRKLAEEGKLTTEVLSKALTDPKLVAGIEKEFGKIPVTFGDIRTAFGNTFTLIAGAFAKGFGISDSLAVILAKVQAWGVSLQPTFESIGKAVRQVFEQLAPVIGAIKDVGATAISFLADNMGTIIGVAKAAAAAFLAFKAAAGAQWIAGTVGQIIALERALGATGAASAIFSAGMKAAQSAVRGLTVAIAANPIGFIAVALTSVITLLYQFRDSIMIGGGSIASLGDLGRAAFEFIGEALSGIADAAKTAFNAIGEFFSDNFGWIADIAGKVFGDLDVSLLGYMRLAARVWDNVIGFAVGAFKALVAYWTGLPNALATIFVNAFNGATAIVEGFINKTIQGVNKVISFANSLGASFDQISEVSLGRLAGGGAVQLGRKMGEAYASGFTSPLEGALNKWVSRADQIAAERQRKADADAKKDDPTKPQPRTATTTDTGTSDGGKADKEAEKAAKKYADAVRDLNDRIKDLTLTKEQKALADELERAGLGRDITQINAKANAIRDLFRTLREGEKAQKVGEIISDFNDKIRELGYSQEQLAQVEARRRAGLNTDLSYHDALTDKLDAEALGWYRVAKAKEEAQNIASIERDQKQRAEDIQFDELARTNPNKAEDERRLAQIERERVANVEKLRQQEGITEEKRAELIANENNLASLRAQGVVLDRQAEGARALTDFLTNLWENPKQAFKSFIGDVLKGLGEAILKAVLLGEKLGGKGGIGGLLSSVISGALGFGGGIGGGRASGGSVSAGDIRWVGENGPEPVMFGAAGTVITNRTARKALGAGDGNNITIGETNIVIQGGADANTQAQLAAQMAAYKRNLIAEIDARLARKR